MKIIGLISLLPILNFCDGRKNVLFLVADDMRPELGCYYGDDFPSKIHPLMHTPNIDALARRSLLLKRAYVQQAVCSPSRTSLLTGRRPDTTHIYDLHSYFRDIGGNFTTIPQYFKMNGYTSVGMGKIFHQGHASNNDDPISWSMPYFHAPNQAYWINSNVSSWRAVSETEMKENPLPDKQITDRAMEVLKNVAPDAKSGKKPFFVAVGFHKPHLPFVFPDKMLQYYPKESIHLPDNEYAPVNMPEIAWRNCKGLLMKPDLQQKNVTMDMNVTFPSQVTLDLRRAYYSAISWIDSLIGRVLTELDDLGLSNNTIVSFFGDHGWQLGEHGAWCKMTNFELATHAPMMIHIPGMTEGGIVSEELTEFVDLFPTLAEAAELSPLQLCPITSSNISLCREGTSLMPLIKEPNTPLKRAAFSQYPRKVNDTIFNVMGYTMRTEKYRYTEWAKFSGAPAYGPDWNILFGVELYDHQTDPDENYNRAMDSSYATIRQSLSQQLRAGWRKAVLLRVPSESDILG
ncbi:hypothetical protein FSP39_007306 [Pinctada imbricata]|uniref:Sulfatase N-terminal domain-containing protein n=1 Tax=Pinctada imbricata TaxID=66713 RepID=A0AA88Y2M2_PINIB|nr:hypothetical protein FSP39_007306 [Pinctada imbricata]